MTKGFKNWARKLSILKVKFIAIFLFLSLVPMLTLTFILSAQATTELKQKVIDEQSHAVQIGADFINAWLNEKISSIEELIQKNPDFKNGDVNNILSKLTLVEQSDPDVSVITYIDRNGQLTDTNGAKLDGMKFDNVIQVMKDKKIILSNISKNAISNKYTIFLEIPILGDQGEFVGAIQPEIDASTLLERIKGIKLGDSAYAYLLSSDGMYIAHPDEQKVGKNFKAFALPEKVSIYENSVFQNEHGHMAYPEKEGPKSAAYSTIQAAGWKLIVTAPEKDVYQGIKQIQIRALLVILISAIIISLIAVYVASYMTRPILDISNMMAKVSQGDLTLRLQVKGRDELEKAKENINLMLSSFAEMIRKITQTTEHVAASSEELTAIANDSTQSSEHIVQSVDDIVRGSDIQVQGSEQTSLAMEEMATGIQTITVSASTVADTALSVVQEVTVGNQEIHHAKDQMARMSHTVANTASMIESLETKSQAIQQTVQLISEIANQTNLLALNASIEAARAGEHGRGFSVVAGEVRKLAEETGHATNHISSHIHEILRSINQAAASMKDGLTEVNMSVVQVENAGTTFERIQRSVQHVNDQIQEVSAVTEQISAGTEEVSASAHEMSVILKDSANKLSGISQSANDQHHSMEEILSASESLSTLANELQEMVSKFKI
ncbi:methyl-accepting chemotaxis protein [Paenibacillus terrigena]|uniref:methyl-accepting chemotaxis protein n=1 Tax=Paenibacillus terrigena TaxID=369333 RepID=UPI0028D203A1|nr:methyl-accepting chemotaxis protein [Paenibacillus terrigena]